jgi:hypothetical protein
MKRIFFCVLLLFSSLWMTACQKEENKLSYLETIDKTAVPVIENAYVSMKEKFPELYEQLWFDIQIPEAMQLYDKGEYDNVVRFSDKSGKNLITLETRFKEQPERYYQQYLHTICANLSELDSFHEYEEPVELNGYSARRIDFRQKTAEEVRLISYFLITVPESPENAVNYHQAGVCVISVESTEENIEPMLRSLNTFQMRGG